MSSVQLLAEHAALPHQDTEHLMGFRPRRMRLRRPVHQSSYAGGLLMWPMPEEAPDTQPANERRDSSEETAHQPCVLSPGTPSAQDSQLHCSIHTAKHLA